MGRVDVGIITIREDEFCALLDQSPEGSCRRVGKREYNRRTLRTRAGSTYSIAIIRTLIEGNLEARGAAEDLIRDLRPAWLFVVGIAGAAPNSEFGLGDVAVSSYVYDLSVEAACGANDREYSIGGGRAH
jgi:nucleoside phosphorylase